MALSALTGHPTTDGVLLYTIKVCDHSGDIWVFVSLVPLQIRGCPTRLLFAYVSLLFIGGRWDHS